MSQTGNSNALGNADKYKTLVSNLVMIVLAPLTAKYVTDAASQQTLYSAVTAIVLGVINLAPLVYELWRRPTASAMAVAVQADKVMSGAAPADSTVSTGPGKPDITIKAS